ncbi:MAG: mechanosensitive ion channel family protein [Woeseiaceae bacterium]
MRHYLIRIAVCCLGFTAMNAVAQEQNVQVQNPPQQDIPEIPADAFERGTPYRSAEGFIKAAEKGDYEVAAEYLDLRNLRGAATELDGAQLARRLYVISKRGTWVDIDQLVDDPRGRSNDNLPNYRDSIGVVLDEGKEVQLFMQRVPRDDGEFIWKVSNASVSLIPELYEKYGYPEVVEDVRRNLPNVVVLGTELFKWVIVLAVAVLAYATAFLLALVVRRILGNRERVSRRRVFRFVAVPFGIWSTIMAMNATATWLGRGEAAEQLQRASPISILLTVWVAFTAINLLRDIYSTHLQKAGRPGALVLLQPAGNALKLLVLIVALLVYLDKLGINITTVLAGLGVGGIAVALALQKPLEDVFGAITLYAQQPIKVGDFCRIGTTLGTIESIGLRTTRIRTLKNTVIAAPNGTVAAEPIDNISARERILYWPNLRLGYDTTPEQIRKVLEGIREMLANHERVSQDDFRVRFKEIGEDAFLIEVYVNLETRIWAEYLELVEELNLQFLEIVAAAGTSLARPAQTLHIEGDSGAVELNE